MYVPFRPGFFKRADYGTLETELTNLFPEEASRYRDDRAFTLLPTPGLVESLDLTGGGDGAVVRAMAHQPGVFDGDLFVMYGAAFIRMTSPTAGSVISPSTGTPFAATSEAQIAFSATDELALVTNGRYYVYNGTTLDEVVVDAALTFENVVYLDGRFFLIPTNDDKFYWSEVLDGDNVGALNFATAERDGDNLMAAWARNGELLLFGTESTEFWPSTGDPNAPVQRRNGATLSVGCVGPRAVISAGGVEFFVGRDMYGATRVYSLQGYSAQPISTPAIEAQIAALTEANRRAIKAWTYTQDGHVFVGFNLPGNSSFVFDISTGEWHQRKSTTGHICNHVVFWENEYIVGSSQDSKIYYQRKSAYKEGNDAMSRVCSTFVPSKSYASCYNFIVDCANAIGNADESSPTATLEWSDNLQTFQYSRTIDFGASAEFSKRIYATRLGRIRPPGRLFRMTFNDPNLYRIDGVRINERDI